MTAAKSKGTYYIAMQYVEGATLKQLIERGLAPDQAVELIRQVLEAARFAHRNGIVHRDLKPQNVIVDPEGKAIVTDFGIARAGVSDITQTGSVMGTPHYLSPEQAQGFEVTAVSDLYSIGVMLYEALTGRVPFEGESAVAVAMKQVSQAPQRPSSINPQVSPALDAVVMRALEKEPGNRFQSADAFIAALDAAMKEPGVSRDTAAIAALPPVIAEPEDEEKEEKSNRKWLWIGLAVAAIVGILIGLALTRDTSADVPNVTGKQIEFAILQLERNGFKVAEKEVQKPAPRGTVLDQDPASGSVEEDCSLLTFFCSKPTVTLFVSGGPGSSAVPGVANLPLEEAREKLEDAGFEVAVERVPSNSVEAGVLIHSEPPAGTSATNGSTVTLVVSSGPKLVGVPALVGTQRSAAVERIRARDLIPSVSEEESSSPVGEVIRQAPTAGEQVSKGSTVEIVVSSGKSRARVPNVIGKLRSEAVQALRDAGLRPVVEEEETEVPGQVGRVVDQFPTPGSQVAPGSEATIVVGIRAEAFPEEEETP